MRKGKITPSIFYLTTVTVRYICHSLKQHDRKNSDHVTTSRFCRKNGAKNGGTLHGGVELETTPCCAGGFSLTVAVTSATRILAKIFLDGSDLWYFNHYKVITVWQVKTSQSQVVVCIVFPSLVPDLTLCHPQIHKVSP